jgi:peptidoglycan-N-acetylglucosamine deacetylase
MLGKSGRIPGEFRGGISCPPALYLPLWFRKASWSTLFIFGGRATARLARLFAPGLWFLSGVEEPACALTFDDAPGELPLLNELLTVLDACDAKATFFVTSGSCETCSEPDALDRIVERGHELGNHLVEDKSYAGSSNEDFVWALNHCEAVIEACWNRCGVPAERRRRWYRPPRGRITSAQRRILKDRGYAVVWGDCFPNDPHNLDGDYIARFVGRNARPGSIIVCHMPERGFRNQTMDGLRLFLPEMRAKGTRVITLDEMWSLAPPRETDA